MKRLLLFPFALLLAGTPVTLAADAAKKPAAEHGHSHEALLPAPTTTLEAVQQVDALVAALKAALAEKRLGDVHGLVEAMSISLSGLERFGVEGLSESKTKRLEGLVKNLREASHQVHEAADEPDQKEAEAALARLELVYQLLPTNLPEIAKEAADKPWPGDFPGKVKAEEKKE